MKQLKSRKHCSIEYTVFVPPVNSLKKQRALNVMRIRYFSVTNESDCTECVSFSQDSTYNQLCYSPVEYASDKAVATVNGTVEEVPLVSDVDELEEDSVTAVRSKSRLSPQSRSHVKLLLLKSSFFVGGVALLIAGGVASHYTSPSSHLDCTDLNSTENSTVSSAIAPTSTSTVPSMYTLEYLSHTATYLYVTPSPTVAPSSV